MKHLGRRDSRSLVLLFGTQNTNIAAHSKLFGHRIEWCIYTFVIRSSTEATFFSVSRLTPSLRFTCRHPSSLTNSLTMCRSFLWKRWRFFSDRSASTCRQGRRRADGEGAVAFAVVSLSHVRRGAGSDGVGGWTSCVPVVPVGCLEKKNEVVLDSCKFRIDTPVVRSAKFSLVHKITQLFFHTGDKRQLLLARKTTTVTPNGRLKINQDSAFSDADPKNGFVFSRWVHADARRFS